MVVYQHYTRQQLDYLFNNRLHVTDFANYLEHWDAASISARQQCHFLQDLRYGNHSRETLDFFPGTKDGSRLLVFIHGGYWQMFDKSKFHFIASAFKQEDVSVAVINYPLAPDSTIDEMVSSCRKAVLWLTQNKEILRTAFKHLYVVGHSAGAHLAAMLVEQEWAKQNAVGIKGVGLISGLFDLRPVQQSYVNDVLQMDDAMALRNSPVALLPVEDCRVLVTVGADETLMFKAQSNDLYNRWKDAAASVEFIEQTNLNHFSIVNALADKQTALHRAILNFMEID